jgi:hypothetical protein
MPDPPLAAGHEKCIRAIRVVDYSGAICPGGGYSADTQQTYKNGDRLMTETKLRELHIEVRNPADATLVGPNDVSVPVAATAGELRPFYSIPRLDRATAS